MSAWAGQIVDEIAKVDPNQRYSNINGALAEFEETGRPHSQTARGQLILSTWDRDPNLAAAMVRYLVAKPVSVQDPRDLIEAGCRLILHEEGALGSLQDEKAALELLKIDWNERLREQEDRHTKAADAFDKLKEQISTTASEQASSHDRLVTEHAATMDRIEKTFTADMTLKAPAAYWTDKRSQHRTVAIVAFISFAILVVAGILLIALTVPELFKTITAKQGAVNWGQAVVITIPALAFFWLLRLVSRIFVSNLTLMSDAAERATFIETFLALLQDEQAQMRDEERLLTLQAIFRPGPGHPGDEGPPAGFLDLIDRLRERAKPGV